MRWSVLADKIKGIFWIKWTNAEHNLKNALWTQGLQKMMRWFLDADDNAGSHQNLRITFWPIYKFPWNLPEIHSVAFALSRQINKVIKFLLNIKLKGGL